MEGGERRFIRRWIIFRQVSQLFRNRDSPSAAAAMVIFNQDIDIRQELLDRRFDIAKPDGLQAHIGVVKVLDGRLDKDDFHWADRGIADSAPTGKLFRVLLALSPRNRIESVKNSAAAWNHFENLLRHERL